MIKKGVKVAQISSSFLIYFHLLPVATEDGKQFQCIKKKSLMTRLRHYFNLMVMQLMRINVLAERENSVL